MKLNLILIMSLILLTLSGCGGGRLSSHYGDLVLDIHRFNGYGTTTNLIIISPDGDRRYERTTYGMDSTVKLTSLENGTWTVLYKDARSSEYMITGVYIRGSTSNYYKLNFY